MCFGSLLVAPKFSPQLLQFFESKNQQQFFYQNLGKQKAPKNVCLQNHGKLRGASEPVVPRGRPINIYFGRKIVPDFPTQKIARAGAKTAAPPKADPKHIVALSLIATLCIRCSLFSSPYRHPPCNNVLAFFMHYFAAA
jgi:hypothetical protein